MIDQVAEKVVRRVILGFLLGGLLLLSYAVLNMFIVPVAWAVILAFATWPAYRRLRASMRRYPTLSALLMTLLLSAAFVLPALWMGMLLRTEVGVAIAAVTAQTKEGSLVLPDFVRSLPWIGDGLQALIEDLTRDPEGLRARMTEWVSQGSDQLVALIGDVGRNAAKLGFALITVFFLYRDGERVLAQVVAVLRRFLGETADASPFLTSAPSAVVLAELSADGVRESLARAQDAALHGRSRLGVVTVGGRDAAEAETFVRELQGVWWRKVSLRLAGWCRLEALDAATWQAMTGDDGGMALPKGWPPTEVGRAKARTRSC